MTDFDFVPFEQTFKRVMTAFRLRLPVPERDELARTYFHVFEAHPIDDVIAAGKRCIARLRTFPKAADWLSELAPTAATCPPDRRTMHADEADALAQATAMRYRDDPCGCRRCQAAGVTERPLRFVPTEFGDDLEQAFNPRTGTVELVGHWAHGEELRRWYDARAVFFGLATKAPRTLLAAVACIVGEREPGEDG